MTAKLSKRHKVKERRTTLLNLRRDGHSYEAIVSDHPELGYGSAASARKDASRGLDGTLREAARDLVATEALRLDRLQLALWPKAMDGDHHAVRELIRLMERRARMLGLDRQADLFAQAAEQDHTRGLLGRFDDAMQLAYTDMQRRAQETSDSDD